MVFPYKTELTRSLSTVGYMCMHLGFGMCMRLATFSWITQAALTVLLPSFFWDELVFKYVFPKTPNRYLYSSCLQALC